jgi:hypothetical protein
MVMKSDELLSLIRRQGMVRPRDLDDHGDQARRRRRGQQRRMPATGAHRPVAAPTHQAAMGAHRHFDDDGEVGVATARSERPTTLATVALLGWQVGRLGGGGQLVVEAARMTGSARLLTPEPARG